MKMRKCGAMFAALMFALSLIFAGRPISALAAEPQPTEQFYVNDYAGIFSAEESDELVTLGEDLYNETGAQVVVLTVDSTDGEEISDYAVRVGRDWGIGTRGEDNGVLIVLALEDRNVWVAVGYGLEGRLPDAKTGRLLDEYAMPYYENKQFSQGTIQLYYALINEVRAEYGLDAVEVPDAPEAEEEGGDLAAIIFAVVLIGAIIAVVLLIPDRWLGKGKGSRRHDDDDDDYGGFDGFDSGSGNSGGGGSFGGGGAGRSF